MPLLYHLNRVSNRVIKREFLLNPHTVLKETPLPLLNMRYEDIRRTNT